MMHTTKERSAAYELTWSLSTKDGKTLVLDYDVHALEELYIADRLWDTDDAHRRVPDPFGVYRFVFNGGLRLVFAQAPQPPNVMLRQIYPPLYSRLRAHETRHRTVRIALPVDEYSALARDVHSPTVREEVSRVFFVLSYRLRSTMTSDPAPPVHETAESAGYIVHDPEEIISSLDLGADKIPVKRRTGTIARFLLPGEPKPGPAPAK